MKKTLIFSSLLFLKLTVHAQQPNLVLCMPMDGNANDLSGNNNNGTVFNALPAPDRFGNPNGAYYFNGIDSYIEVNNSTSLTMSNSQDFSVSFWMKSKATATTSDVAIVAKHVSGSWNGFFFVGNNSNGGYCTKPNNLTFYVAAGALEDACADNGILADTSNWYFVTGVYSGTLNNTYIYINGQLQSDVGTNSGTLSNTANLIFGAIFFNPNYAEFFNGYLDDARIYSKALTVSEISDLYNGVGSCTSATGINEPISISKLFELFPNPAKQKLNIKCNSNYSPSDKIIISVYSNDGKLVKKESLDMNTNQREQAIDIENLADGFYHLNIFDGRNSLNFKFIKE